MSAPRRGWLVVGGVCTAGPICPIVAMSCNCPMNIARWRSIVRDMPSKSVSRIDIPTGCVVFLCSDGLTKHVPDAEISKHIGAMESSEQLCRTLLDLTLERGGSDNVTIISARARVRA